MKTIVITPHVINTINSLPEEERLAIAVAMTGEMILGADASKSLTPTQEIIYAMIKQYVRRDTERCLGSAAHISGAAPSKRSISI